MSRFCERFVVWNEYVRRWNKKPSGKKKKTLLPKLLKNPPPSPCAGPDWELRKRIPRLQEKRVFTLSSTCSLHFACLILIFVLCSSLLLPFSDVVQGFLDGAQVPLVFTWHCGLRRESGIPILYDEPLPLQPLPEIKHHTVWRMWLFIAYPGEKWSCYQFLLYLTHNPGLSWNFPASLFSNMRRVLYRNAWITMLKTRRTVLVLLRLNRTGCWLRNRNEEFH